MTQETIDEILDIFKDYLGDELLKCNICIKPNYFSLNHISNPNYLMIDRKDKQEKIKKIIGKDKGFNFTPSKGMILWRIRQGGKRILEFKSDPILNHYNSHIKNLKINLNTKIGSISHPQSNHEKIASDGYIGDPDKILDISSDFQFLSYNGVKFKSNENNTIFYDNSFNFLAPKYQIEHFYYQVIPNHLINM